MGYYGNSPHTTPSFPVPQNNLPDVKKELLLKRTNIAIDTNRIPDKAVSALVEKTTLTVDSPSVPALKKDNTNFLQGLKKTVSKFIPKGTVSLGYDYGFLPYTVNMRSPASAIRTEGLIETDVLGIPLDVTFFYSTQKNLVGLNNYYRISYNADRYKNKLDNKLNTDLETYQKKLQGLHSNKQLMMQKMAYADYLASINPNKWPIDNSKPELQDLDQDLPSLQEKAIIDTSEVRRSAADSLKQNKYISKEDSIVRQARLYKSKKDSVLRAYDNYKNKYDQLTDSIKYVQSKIDELDAMINGKELPPSHGSYLNKVQQFYRGIKRLDVGLCYPAYSTFLTNNTAVRGINFEYQKSDLFFAFTYGTTVSTLLYSNRSVDGFLRGVRNSYNYFDITNLSAGRKILSAKFGVGTKEKDHFFAGFLIGKGFNDYSRADNPSDIASRLVESNLVIEADAQKKLGANTVLNLIIGKSSLQDGDLNMTLLKQAANELFSGFRSYAALVKLKTAIRTTKSSLSFSVRWVDPFFSSFGLGFLRSDNMRYEIKLEQPIIKSLRYTVAARYEEDNLLKLLNYKNTFYSINNSLTYRVKKGLMVRLGYTPLVRNLNGDNYHFKTRNSIITGIVTFTPKSKLVKTQFNFLYNYYLVNTDSTPVHFQNFTYFHQISFKSGFKTGLNLSWFKNNLKDTTGNNLFMAVLDAGYQFKSGSSLSVAGKCAYKINGAAYPGFIFKAAIKLSSHLYWENQAEKFIVGDLFNGYDLENLKRFPYCFTTKLILNF